MTKKDYIFRRSVSFTVILLALALVFWITYLIAGGAAKVAAVFPTRNCKEIRDAYGSEYLEEYAVKDAQFILANPNTVSSGCL